MARKPAAARNTAASAPGPRPLLEWIVAGLGLIVTAAVLIMLTRDAVAPAAPPALSARVAAVAAAGGGFEVEVEVANRGRQTAAAVAVEGVLTPPAGAPETATASLDYAPGRGAGTVTLTFREDPRRGRLELTVRGWSEP